MKSARNIFRAAPAAALLALALLLFTPAAFAAGAGGPQPGEIGDHHATTDQHSVTHFSGALMFWEYLTFGIVVIVLGKFVLPVLLKQLDQRSSRIQDALDKADQVRADAEMLLKKHEEMMRDAHLEAQKITEAARAAGKEVAARIQSQADIAAKETKERSAREVELLQKKAEAELREYAVELALAAGSRVLERSLGTDEHRRLAKEAIAASQALKN